MAFAKIDKALEEYYKSLGKSDYSTNGTGKFLEYCKENGFEEDDIDEEFGNEPSECLYVEFDEEFPLNPAINDPTARVTEIFRIIKYCYDHGKSPTSSSSANESKKEKKTLNVYNIDIITDNRTQKECDKVYKKQCKEIYKDEASIKKCFAIGLKNNYPFLINLIDSFMRDKADYIRDKKRDLPLVKWRDKSQYFRKISKEKKKMADTLLSGVETFLRRGFPVWQFGPKQLVQIQDDVKILSLYMLMSYNFIKSILNTRNNAPFQTDFIIAVYKSKQNINTNNGDISGDSTDDASDDEPVDDEKYVDEIGDIQKKLSSNKCTFVSAEINVNMSDTAKVTRLITKNYSDFKAKLSESSHYKKHKNEIKDYPLRKRFCAVIDRRECDKAKDKLIFFEPPSNCNTIPNGHVPEWYYNALKTCIIPSVKDSKHHPIRADTTARGQILTISYHVEAADKMRVYFFWNGKYTRVYPQDVDKLFTEIVDMDYGSNKKWSDKDKEAVLSQMKFTDSDFESFYKQVSSKKHHDFPKQYQ